MITLNAVLNKDEGPFKINDSTEFLESYFLIGLDYYSDFNEAYTDISSEFYTALKEEASEKLLAFNKFFNSAKKLLVNYAARMNSNVYNQFTSAILHKAHSDMSDMGPYLKRISEYNGEDIVSTNIRYKYSYLFDNIVPSMKVFNSYAKERNELDISLKSTRGLGREKILDDAFEKVQNYIMSGDCYSYARGSILDKKDTRIKPEEYAAEIFKVYRSGGDEISTPVNKTEILEIADRFKKYERAIVVVNEQKKSLFKEYQYIIDHLQNYDMFQSKYLEYNPSVQEKYEIYAKLKTDQLMHYCALYMQAFNGKLDAIANSYIQDREILIKVCGSLGMDISKEGGTETV